MNKLILLIILLIISCSDKKKLDSDVNKFKVSTLSGYVEDEIINIKKLDSSSAEIFDSWNLILIISSITIAVFLNLIIEMILLYIKVGI